MLGQWPRNKAKHNFLSACCCHLSCISVVVKGEHKVDLFPCFGTHCRAAERWRGTQGGETAAISETLHLSGVFTRRL